MSGEWRVGSYELGGWNFKERGFNQIENLGF
jgi:hypothetical protein